ncbi:ComEC/Rec2 family competence protein [Natronococcus occultus]|uniref:Putative hydrolase (Metallo-beta-lactamase superfamily) n=1 Tax=Natronococcus occultus SP4 TaxID=694430 RepID=L0K0D4_9EURY|nr:ComEC/Rec2 family competence protein [Natronococcus occultus]AGB38466.1 putative hydrolase (metallo-beta-lactamase superfamily) [Natronococcus occultus SP4]
MTGRFDSRARQTLLVVAVVAVLLLGGCIGDDGADGEEEATEPDAPTGELEIHHLDVGQADATLLVAPSGETILIDTGDWRDDSEDVIDYLEERGVDRIDHLVATHAHADHIGGHAAVIDHFETHRDGVGAAYDSGVVHTSATYERYLEAVESHEVTLFQVAEGDELPLEDDAVGATVLNPPAGESGDDLHYNSVTLSVEFGEFTYLTTGDAERDAERRLVEDRGEELGADVYQAGHHGSSTSSTEPFLDAVEPRVAVISSAEDSQYGHPHDDVLESFADRGVETYWTGVHGHVVVTTDGEEASVEAEREATTDPAELREHEPDAEAAAVGPSVGSVTDRALVGVPASAP